MRIEKDRGPGFLKPSGSEAELGRQGVGGWAVEYLRDPEASASHFVMAVLTFVASLFLVRMTRGEGTRRWTVAVFAGCAVALYLASGLYHAVRLPPEERVFFQLLDMSAIFLMIAGSATPLIYLLIRGRLRRALLLGQWGFAVVGIAALWLAPRPDVNVLIPCYMLMGWLACAGLGHYYRATGWSGLRWFLASLAVYTLGAVIELLQWPTLWPGVIRPHEILHVCDMGGTALYMVFLARFVIPYQHPQRQGSPARSAYAASAQT